MKKFNLPIYSAIYKEFAGLESTESCTVVTEHLPDEPGILILHGGSDIATSIYGEYPNGAHSQFELTSRDTIEVSLWEQAQEKGTIIVGICRGAQLACALSGGSLHQDIRYHNSGEHKVNILGSTKRMTTNSYHHQAMKLPKDAKLIANSTDGVVEMAVCHRTRSFMIQGHPEWMHDTDPYYLFFLEQLHKFVNECTWKEDEKETGT